MGSDIVRVLLVDSDQERCRALSAALDSARDPSFRVIPVWESLAAALETLRDHRYHVVILDLDHPDTEGFEGLVAVRDVDPSVAIVVLAGTTVDEDIVSALKLGAADYLLRSDIEPSVVLRVTRYAAQRRHAQEQQHRAESRYRQLFRDSLDAVLVTRESGLILDANTAALNMLGLDAEDFVDANLVDRCADAVERERLSALLARTDPVGGREIRLESMDRTERICLVSTTMHHPGDEGGSARHVILRDITSRKRMEERLLHDALHDPLTGLPNRALFHDRLAQAAERRRRDASVALSVMFVDLDRFKWINDQFGHEAGDDVLRHVSRSLAGMMRGQDTVARMGGDEFAILLEGASLGEAQDAGERFLAQLRQPVRVGRAEVRLSASIGIAEPHGDGDPSSLLHDADTAMYRAKSTGRGRVQVFDPAMSVETERTFALEGALRQAVPRGELLLMYQPIYDARAGDLKGFEALVRWRHPERGLLQPRSFIPFAEETGLIVDLGEAVLRMACEQMADWGGSRAETGPYISVNVSAKQFMQPDLVERFGGILGETGADPRRVRLELTESTLMHNAERTVRMLRRLRDLGLELWIDDFGTGYSSLSYLQRFPVSAVKIERGFVARTERNEGDPEDPGHGVELVRTVITLARSLGLTTIAEGVETAAQVRTLRELGAVSLQGFVFSRPVERPDLDEARARGPAVVGGA